MPEGKAIVEWIAFDRLKQASALFNLLLSPAFAEGLVATSAQMRVAQVRRAGRLPRVGGKFQDRTHR
jgi:hypothetical protein